MNKRQKSDAKFRAQAVGLAEMSDGNDGGLLESEREELARLCKENREWAMERKILKKRP